VSFGQHPERGEGIGMKGLPRRDGFFGKDLDIVWVTRLTFFMATNPCLPLLCSDATKIAVLPSAPRRRLPGCLPPTTASSGSMMPSSRYRWFWSPIATHSFRSIRWAVIQGTPNSLGKRKAEMLPLSVDTQYMHTKTT
jgi:hypothetical protein